MFQSPLQARERILLYGEPGTGKSNAVISIAKFLKSTHSAGRIFVIDNDKSYQRVAELMGLGDHLQVEECYDFPDHRAALEKFVRTVRPDDWLVCDLMSEVWSCAQTFYTDSVYDDEANYFLKVRQAMNNPAKENVLDGWTDWQYVNKIYSAFARPFIYKSPCHVIAVSTAEPVSRAKPGSTVGDDKETISVFGSVGFRPEGQKRLRHQFNTTILMHKDNRSRYLMTTVKDRDRELVVSQPVNNFAIDYLKGIAQWTLS